MKTVGELLKVRNNEFDPMNLDTSEIRELSNAMPKDGNIDVNNAENMATKYLRGADICSEWLAVATAYVSKTKDAKQRAYNQAFLIKTEGKDKLKTDKMRTAYAELDEDYQLACSKYNEAMAFARWVDSKYNSFVKMHYLCKKILERGYEHERASSWNGSVDEDSWKKDLNEEPGW